MGYENAPGKQETILRWIKNGLTRDAAEELHNDMVNDPAYSDPDRTSFDDPTIDDRLNKAETYHRKS
ncbi:hypothetical protein ACPV50_09550 [Vibrio astriarenae]